MFKKIVIYFFIIIFVFLPITIHSELQEIPEVNIKIRDTKQPQTISEAQELGKNFLSLYPLYVKSAYNEFLSIIKDIYYFGKNNIYNRIVNFFKKKFNNKKQIIEQEIEKEKESVKVASKSLWQRILEYFRIR